MSETVKWVETLLHLAAHPDPVSMHCAVPAHVIESAAHALAAARREVETAQQRCEWVATALHGDPMFGAGCDEPLVQQVRALQAALATVTRERDGWERRTKEISSVVLRAWEVLRKWWQFSKLEERDEPFADALARAIAEDKSHDAYALSEMRRLNDALATSRAALEDVRRVEEWLRGNEISRFVDFNNGVLCAVQKTDAPTATAESLEALGRALAQEAGDATA